ncbi:hypothetical protein EV356DRAFT_59469 [Viridothelium virens]|uniref:Uncharacterized protein n=1 Tax=Viridothelium virens TaxID=1048519 RepID=A0A6A6HGB0_VIRVR|nr:hypothetical protein EV356DRAFT_59469 [Viridothelium virens]
MEESRYVTTIAVGIVMATLASIAVALRFRARRVRKVSFKADDYAVVIALICLLGQCICNLVGEPQRTSGVTTHPTVRTFDVYCKERSSVGWERTTPFRIWILLTLSHFRR